MDELDREYAMILAMVRERFAEGPPIPLADVAASIGLDPDDYR